MARFVAISIVLVGCATANDPRLGGDAHAPPADTQTIDVPDGCVATAELCNGADEDCDGNIDETFVMKGMTCSVGMGACMASGHYTCSIDGHSTVCDAIAGMPSAEICDGIDNDCDGHVDEDFHVGMPCDGPDADTCAEGVIMCMGTGATMCSDTTGDSIELCDGMDNDCDGHTDEGYNLGTACDGPDSDACAEGVVVCNGSGGTTCNDTSGDSVERCNGIDDDCRNGIDDPWPTLGQACSVGLGSCMRSGQIACNGAQTGVQCNATPGAPTAETCGNGIDEDCNGGDAACPSNDLPAGAIDISNGGTFTVDLSAAHDDNWAASTPALDCGDQGGRDAFYTFTLPAAEVVYYDTFGSNFDSVVRVFAGSCTSLGTIQACADDACASTRSQGAVQLAAGTYCLVVDQFSQATTAGAATLTFKRGGRTGIATATTSATLTGTTTGKANQSIAGCEANSSQPDVGYFFLTCPATTYTIGASTCTGTAFDSVIYLRSGAATSGDVSCSDDVAGCGNNLQSSFSGVTVSGANLQWLIVDGFGQTGNGNYTLMFTVQ